MASPKKQSAPKPRRNKPRRSAFRAEFYQGNDAEKRRAAAAARAVHRGRQRQRVPLMVTVGCLGIVLCMIAVGGSSAVIWLRKLGALFGVHWAGDY